MQISIGRRYNSEKKQGERTDLTCGKFYHKSKTSEKLANEYQISPKSIRNYAKKAEQYEQLKQEKPEKTENDKMLFTNDN